MQSSPKANDVTRAMVIDELQSAWKDERTLPKPRVAHRHERARLPLCQTRERCAPLCPRLKTQPVSARGMYLPHRVLRVGASRKYCVLSPTDSPIMDAASF